MATAHNMPPQGLVEQPPPWRPCLPSSKRKHTSWRSFGRWRRRTLWSSIHPPQACLSATTARCSCPRRQFWLPRTLSHYSAKPTTHTATAPALTLTHTSMSTATVQRSVREGTPAVYTARGARTVLQSHATMSVVLLKPTPPPRAMYFLQLL